MVGEQENFIKETNLMLHSAKNLDNRFEFVLFADPINMNHIKGPESLSVNIYPYKAAAGPYYDDYPYAKSLEFLNSNKHILSKYDYIVKTDTDVLFSDAINRFGFDDYLHFGEGHYSFNHHSDIQIKMLAQKLGYSGYLWTSGRMNSTVFGPSEKVIDLMHQADLLCPEVLRSLSPNTNWRDDAYKWGEELYSGVSTLIATDIIAWSVYGDSIRISDRIDAGSDDTGTQVQDVFHMHCYHTNEVFSKFKMYDGHYDNFNKRDDNSLSSYCLNTYLDML